MTLDLDTFFDKTAFLRDDEEAGQTAPTDVAQSRENLGSYLGLGLDWYSEPKDRTWTTLFEYLQNSEDGPSLLDELEASNDPTDEEQLAWTQQVENEVYYTANPDQRYTEPELDANYQIPCRYDRKREDWYFQDPDTGEWLDHNQAAAWWAQQHADSAAVTEEDYTSPAWDPQWEMLERFNHKLGTYEYAYSDDQQTVRPGTRWYTYDELNTAEAGASLVAKPQAPAQAVVPDELSIATDESLETAEAAPEDPAEAEEWIFENLIKPALDDAGDLSGISEEDMQAAITEFLEEQANQTPSPGNEG